MNERTPANGEKVSAQLLVAFQRLLGLIDDQGHKDLVGAADKVKRLIFEQLVANEKIDIETSFEIWQTKYFGGQVSHDNALLIEMAREHNLIDEQSESEFLKANMRELFAMYRQVNGAFTNPQLSTVLAVFMASEKVNRDDYNELSNQILRSVYG